MKWFEVMAAWLYVLVAEVEGVFHQLNAIKCPKCGCRESIPTNHSYLHPEYSGVTLEFDLVCAECRHTVNYWGYGNQLSYYMGEVVFQTYVDPIGEWHDVETEYVSR